MVGEACGGATNQRTDAQTAAIHFISGFVNASTLRIAFAMINCNRRDGSARAVNEVAERLADKGHEVHLYARCAEDLDFKKVRWHRVPGPRWPEVADFWSYHVAVNRRLSPHRSPRSTSPYDIIHSVGPNTSRANVVTIQNVQSAKTKLLRKLGRDEQVSLLRRISRALYLSVTSRAERILYSGQPPYGAGRERFTCWTKRPLFLPVSKGVERELREHYEISDSPVKIISNAADTTVFRPIPRDERRFWREANGLQPADFVCLFTGGEWARKGLDLAIRAVALIGRSDVKLFVAGDDPDRERYVRLASQLQIGDRVVFGGFRRDIEKAMAAADLFLFPSWYEAFSLATIEAAASGLPILASRINGAEDFVLPGENGAFIEHDPEQIAATLRPLTIDCDLCQRMGSAARRLVEQDYTWDQVAEKTDQAYRDYLFPGQYVT